MATVHYEHKTNPKIKGTCTEEQWEKLSNHPSIGKLYKEVRRVKTPPEAKAKKAEPKE